MRMDVKVGVFAGITALVLAGWFFWPKNMVQKPKEAIAVGGRDAIPVDHQIARPSQAPVKAPEFTVPPPPSVTDTTTPNVSPGVTPATPASPSASASVAAAPTAPNSETPAPATPSLEPSIPPSAAQGATAQAGSGPAAIGREPLIHVVRAGDTLEKIAQIYYGNTTLAGALRQANPQLRSSKNLRAGTKIKVPAETDLPRMTQTPASTTSDASLAVHVDTGVTTVSAGVPATQPAATMVLGAREYRVQKGDTLYSIASRQLGSGSRWQELLALNSQSLGGKPSGLRPGQVLRLAAK